MEPKRLIIGITGATGSVFGVRLLEVLQSTGVETHLIVSRWGGRTLLHETAWTVEQVRALATFSHAPGDMGAAIASGSFLTEGMIVAPCSVRTLAAIATGMGDNLIHRAADVVLKEHRRLVLLVREMPLSEVHLDNMLRLARMGAVILPPVPAFYSHPRSLDDVVNQVASRALDQFGIHLDLAPRWEGELERAAVPER